MYAGLCGYVSESCCGYGRDELGAGAGKNAGRSGRAASAQTGDGEPETVCGAYASDGGNAAVGSGYVRSADPAGRSAGKADCARPGGRRHCSRGYLSAAGKRGQAADYDICPPDEEKKHDGGGNCRVSVGADGYPAGAAEEKSIFCRRRIGEPVF